ncbi:MAG: protein-export chaperone SecB [Rhodospirillales bacterium]|nr:protein-export chaperone SecB [Rhodospirillales bacterium]
MSDDTQEPVAEEGAAKLPPIQINAQYIKDLSFEAPATPGIFSKMQSEAPDVTINVDVNAHPVQERIFEIQLHIRATCAVGEETAFISELVYGGLFTINVPDEHLQPMLLIECPRLLFPFARNIIADTTRDGGFPPLMMAPVDFVAMFQNQANAAAAAKKEADA